MADPLSIASGTAGLLSLGIQVIQSLVNFYNTYKDQDADLARITRNLQDLQNIFRSLETAVQDSRSQANAQELLKDVDKITQTCQEIIEELQFKCKKFDASLSKSIMGRAQVSGLRATYPFRKSTLNKLEQDIGDIRENLSLALNVLQVKKESQIQFDLSETMAIQISSNIRGWLKAPDASIDHDIASRKRHSSTGLWLANNGNFTAWLTKRNSFLWIYGFAGCGKSVLCSTAIQHTFHQMKGIPSVGVAFFYFSFTDASKQNENGMLRALLLQLSSQIADGETELRKLYEAHVSSAPKSSALLDSLRSVVSLFDKVFIFLDAIDESPRDNQREGVLEGIDTIRKWNLPCLHLLVTSRNLFDISESLHASSEEVISMKNLDVDRDIANFISDQLKCDKKIQRWKAFHSEIQEKLTQRAQGVFRYVECQLKELRRARNEKQLIDCLNSLPRDLDETYERILCSIDKMYIDDVRRILTVLCISHEPLTIDELIEAHTVDLSEPQHVDRTRAFQEDDIREICLGLVEIPVRKMGADKRFLSTRIAHFSVQEYLQSDRILQQNAKTFAIQPRSANAEMAEICLVYLSNPMLHNGTLDEENRNRAFPLVHYAAEHWHPHYLDSGGAQQKIKPLIMKHFNNEASPLFKDTSFLRFHGTISWSFDDSIWLNVKPLWLAAFLGLGFVIDSLTSSGGKQISPVDIANARYGNRYNALVAASGNGHVKAVQMLLERGAPAEQFDSALYEASFGGQEQIAQILLDRGANPNNCESGLLGSAFLGALQRGHERIVQLLLDRGADANTEDPFGRYALDTAAASGHVKITQILIDNGADINVHDRMLHRSPLDVASSHNQLGIMQMLLDLGADIGSALQWASYEGHEEAINMLLDKGVDINARQNIFTGLCGFLHGDALQVASLAGHENIVRLLLQRGADFTVKSKLFSHALDAMFRLNIELEVVRFLRERYGEAPNIQMIAIGISERIPPMQIVHIMSKEGFDVSQSGLSGDALAVASFSGHENIVQILRERGAHMTQGELPNGKLTLVSSAGREKIAQILIEESGPGI